MTVDVLVRLQHLADSALPIGTAAHSFGLESLVNAGLLTVENLEPFLNGYLEETGALDAWYCAASCRLTSIPAWMELNAQIGARKPARESREASAALGRRFLHLASSMAKKPLLAQACAAGGEVHMAASFGLTAGAIGVAPELAAAAFLQQSMTSLISCCQRLLPLGQTRAHEILWNLKPAILQAAIGQANCFAPLLDVASARHPLLSTRLFIS